MTEIHPAAAKGFAGFGKEYALGRPGYPEELLELFAELGMAKGTKVLDLAAGTGKFTRLLSETGADVTAVEPLAGMRDNFEVPGIQPVAGTAEKIPFPDGSFDFVTVAQAFHWFDHGAALREIHRALRGGGLLLLAWNTRDVAEDWVAKIAEIVDPIQSSVPDYERQSWEGSVGDSGLFSSVSSRVLPYSQPMTREAVRHRFGSSSYVNVLSGDERARVLDRIDEVITEHPATRGRKLFEMPYLTEIYWMTAL